MAASLFVRLCSIKKRVEDERRASLGCFATTTDARLPSSAHLAVISPDFTRSKPSKLVMISKECVMISKEKLQTLFTLLFSDVRSCPQILTSPQMQPTNSRLALLSGTQLPEFSTAIVALECRGSQRPTRRRRSTGTFFLLPRFQLKKRKEVNYKFFKSDTE